MSNNPPDKIVELTQKQHDFLLRNVEANIAFGLISLQNMTGDGAVRMVEMLEQFKELKTILEKAK